MNTKLCIGPCGREFPVEDFPVRKANSDGHTSKCYDCTRMYNRKDYAENRPSRFAKNNKSKNERRVRNKEYVVEYLSTHPCVDCGESDILVLDFDHVKGEKLNDISTMVQKAYRLDILTLEISKCEVRCANDHRRVTHRRRVQN